MSYWAKYLTSSKVSESQKKSQRRRKMENLGRNRAKLAIKPEVGFRNQETGIRLRAFRYRNPNSGIQIPEMDFWLPPATPETEFRYPSSGIQRA